MKANNAESDMERLREEKDEEIMVLNESVNDTIGRLSDAQEVGWKTFSISLA